MSITMAALNQSPTQVTHYPNGSVKREQWRVNGRLHRVDGPAVIEYLDTGSARVQQWYLDGQQHRGDGPAVIEHRWMARERREWWVHGRQHRSDGPAVVTIHPKGSHERVEWWCDGWRLSAREATLACRAADPRTNGEELARLARQHRPFVARLAVTNRNCPQELRFLAELEHPDWF